MKGGFVQRKITDEESESALEIKAVSSDIRILYLSLKKKWFDQIADGIKKVEYREVKDYWVSRLFNRDGIPIPFDYVFFRNGYSKDSPSIVVEYRGVVGVSDFENVECFEIALGDVCKDIEISKWKTAEEKVSEKREKEYGFR